MKKLFLQVQYLAIVFFLFTAVSCTNTEGFGGGSSVEGVLIQRFYNDDYSVLQAERPAVDHDVFIMFGDDKLVGDDVETSIAGYFRFDFLRPGDYSIYYFSDDTSKTELAKVPLSKKFKLNSGETLSLDTLYTYRTLDWDDGHAKIKGRVMLINYKNSSSFPNLEVKDVTPAQELPVYITYNHGDFYNDRIRTQDDGTFVFPNLLKGHYRIFVYSEDVITGGTADFVRSIEVEITETNQVYIIEDDIIIENH